MHIPSPQQRSPTQRRHRSASPSGADATDTRQTQLEERVPPRPETSGSAVSSSRLSSSDDNVLRLVSPQRPPRHDGRQHKQSPLRDSPQSNGADPGPLVWVRVTRSGKPALREPGGAEESYWWPACITEGRLATGPLTVSLYGEISPAAPKSIRLEAPSPSHILPFKLPGQDIPRFSSFTFRCREPGIQQQSLSKRPKTVLDDAWHSAVDLAHEVDASLNDGLPSNLSSYRVDTVRIHKEEEGTVINDGSEKAKPTTNSPKTSSERYSPPPCDPLLEIPGELVFALDKRGRTDYWAARVERYLPPKTPSLPSKYRVRFKDGTFRVVSRDMFYTSDEPEFYTCRLGRYMSDGEESEADTDGEYVQYETGAEEPATLLPPPNPEDFCELPIREQFAYVKPIIRAILNETYLPARERHRAFMQGGLSRFRLQKAATGKGDLTVRDVSRLGRVLQNWVLGPMHLRKVSPPSSPPGYLESESGLSTQTDIQVEHLIPPDSLASPNSTPSSQPSQALSSIDVGPSESLRQGGSPSYEALSESDKLQYCLLVLFHEATLQLLLWRSGERRSPDLLSQGDEERLRLIGLAKSEERAWVEEITRIREVKTRKKHPSSPRPRAAVKRSSSGRTLRPRNPPDASIC